MIAPEVALAADEAVWAIPAEQAEVRVCLHCPTRLSRYNKDLVCHACRDKMRKPRRGTRAKRRSPAEYQRKKVEAGKHCAMCERLVSPASDMCRQHAGLAAAKRTVLKAGSVEEWRADLLWANLSAEEKLGVLATQQVLYRSEGQEAA